MKQDKPQIDKTDLERIGTIVIMELHRSRNLRRRIKGTRMEDMILQILKQQNEGI